MQNFQSQTEKKLLGEILVSAGLISIAQIKLALQEQQHSGLRLGKILVYYGWIKQQTVDFFAERWQVVLKEEKKPLIYYLQEAGLIDKKQIKDIIKFQQSNQTNMGFYELAVERGYIKQITVDFFLASLFNIHKPDVLSLVKPYELVKNFLEGKKDFKNIDLSNAPLMGVSLRGINLDNSNLKKINLSKANLSQSSLVQVNLVEANLTQAVFTRVDFSRSFLTRATLNDAYLDKVNFQSAILHEIDFESAYLAQADFSGADLTGCKFSLHYTYDVYYDDDTIFDLDFNPKLLGWKNRTNF